MGSAYTFLVEKAAYQNHFYLLCLISFFMIWIPSHRTFSIDAWRGWIRSDGTVPTWTLWLLRGQIAIVYFFGGLAKLNSDWLHGEPMQTHIFMGCVYYQRLRHMVADKAQVRALGPIDPTTKQPV